MPWGAGKKEEGEGGRGIQKFRNKEGGHEESRL